METNDIYGQDILLDEYLQPVVSESGEQLLTQGVQTVVQQVKLRLATPINEETHTGLFYKPGFGSNLHLYIREEDSPENRNAIITETVSTINKDSRINPNKTMAKVESKANGSIRIVVQFEIVNEASPFNLVIEPGTDTSMLIRS